MSFYNAELDDAGYDKQKWLLEKLNLTTVTVVDVGANVGQSIDKYRTISPGCSIFSFEPHPQTFSKLQIKCDQMDGVLCEKIALGPNAGSAAFYATNCPEASSLLPPEEFIRELSPNRNYDFEVYEVCVRTLDETAEKFGVSNINVLKIDVQGAELGVLQGSQKLLSENRIDLIYSEVLFAENYEGQCDFNDIYNYLKPFGYVLWDVFPFLHTHLGRLWTGNALFVSSEAMHRIDPKMTP